MRFALQFPSWALYDKWWVDPSKRWKNAIMVSPDWPDQLEKEVEESVLDLPSQIKREREQVAEGANRDTYKVEYRAQWAEVLDAYLDPAMVDAAFSGHLPDGRLLIMTRTGGTYLHDYKAHCDPSSTTAGFGFALGHIEEFPDATMRKDGKPLWPDGKARHVVFDIVKRWNPKDFPGETIHYPTVKEELLYYLKTFPISELTFS